MDKIIQRVDARGLNAVTHIFEDVTPTEIINFQDLPEIMPCH